MKLRPIVGLSALFSYPLSRQRRAATSSAPKSRSNEPKSSRYRTAIGLPGRHYNVHLTTVQGTRSKKTRSTKHVQIPLRPYRA